MRDVGLILVAWVAVSLLIVVVTVITQAVEASVARRRLYREIDREVRRIERWEYDLPLPPREAM